MRVEKGTVLCQIKLPIRFPALSRILDSIEKSYGRDVEIIPDGQYLVLYAGEKPK